MTKSTTCYAITVEFVVDAGRHEEFMELMNANAIESVRAEPGCLRFDVLTSLPQAERPIVFLYEIYADRAAFDAHLASPHFKRFDEQTRAMVRKKTVGAFAVTQNGKADF